MVEIGRSKFDIINLKTKKAASPQPTYRVFRDQHIALGNPQSNTRGLPAMALYLSKPSDWAAASVTENKTIWAGAWRNYDGSFNNDRSAGGHDNGTTIGMAPAIRAAIHAGAASAFSIGCAKAKDSAAKQQHRAEKNSHSFLRRWGAQRRRD